MDADISCEVIYALKARHYVQRNFGLIWTSEGETTLQAQLQMGETTLTASAKQSYADRMSNGFF